METDHSISMWSVLLLSVPLVVRTVWDGHRILVKRKEVNHGKHWSATAFFIFVSAFSAWRLEPVEYLFQPLLLSWGIFWMLFDYMLNIIRGKDFFYIDVGLDGKQSNFDRIYEWLGPYGTFAVKLWFLLLTILVYFHLSYIIGERTPW